MSTLRNLKQAAIHIAQRYLFNEQNYPILAKLTEIEKKVFAINHCVLHILKSTPGFITSWHTINVGGLDHSNKEHKEVMVKMLINSLKLAEVVGMSADEVGSVKQQYDRASTSYFDLLEYTKLIATQCESFDHKGKFDEKVVKQNALSILQLVLAGLNQDNDKTPCMRVPFQYKEALELIPAYMKSK
jgi:hypothetical protein